MKLIHTADLHLDLSFARFGRAAGYGNRRRQSLRDVFQSIVQRAGEWPADALLLAGDLFEGDRVTRDTAAFLAAQFQSILHVPVCIAPGNHDPYTDGSIYASEPWPDNVHIFSRPEWSSVSLHEGALTVHGFAFDGPDISSNPFGSLELGGAPGIHAAVCHGSERSHQPSEKTAYAPFEAAEAAARGLSYLALGHFHQLTRVEGDFETVAYYSGSPEGHSFGELGMHYYLEVEVDGGTVEVRPVESSRLIYTSHTIGCSDFSSSQDLIEAVRRMLGHAERPEAAHVTLTGPCAPAVSNEIPAVYDVLAPELEYLVISDRTEPLEDYEAIIRDGTSLSAFVRTLTEEITDAAHDEPRREMLERAREVGVAAFRQRDLDLRGLERA